MTTEETPSDMMKKMKEENEDLRRQLNMHRAPISESASGLIHYTENQRAGDPMLHPLDKRDNPWIEKSRCTLL